MTVSHTLGSIPVQGHSARVTLLLHAQGLTFDLADVGPKDAYLREPAILPDGDAILEIITDGRSQKSTVTLKGSAQATKYLQFS